MEELLIYAKLTQLFSIFKDAFSDSLSLCLEISFYYICRIDELLKLRLNQFEIVDGQGVLSLEPMKKGNEGEIFLNSVITEKLKAIKENSNGGKWFFPDPNDPERPLCYDQIYNKFKKARSKSGVKNVVINN
jgi:integrase